MFLKNYLLPRKDALYLIELIQASLSCKKEGDFRELMNRLSHLIPHDFAICALAKMESNGVIKSYEVINISYPDEWLDLYIRRKYHQIDPIAQENFSKFELQYWADTYKLKDPPKSFLYLAEDFGLRKGYTHGLTSPQRKEGSLFSLSGDSIEHCTRTEFILKHIVPHLHQALSRTLGQHVREHKITLSPREKEVLNWIKQGKSSWDISVILGISENTVKFHIMSILKKLDVVGRTQAVAVAIKLGLIDIE